jgi:molecular chaperone IbpA
MGNKDGMWRLDHTFADLDKWSKHFIGLDRLADNIYKSAEHVNKTMTSYPPFNLKKTEEDKYVLEMAIAGFGKNDIEITLQDDNLVINGKTTIDTLTADGVNQTFLHKGISDRPFTRTFTIADNVEIKGAEMINGLLKIWLEHVIPEHKKPKKIDIVDESGKSQKKFLTENK